MAMAMAIVIITPRTPIAINGDRTTERHNFVVDGTFTHVLCFLHGALVTREDSLTVCRIKGWFVGLCQSRGRLWDVEEGQGERDPETFGHDSAPAHGFVLLLLLVVVVVLIDFCDDGRQ